MDVTPDIANHRRFVLDTFEPAYLSLPAAELHRRVAAGRRELSDCCACPRKCHADRLADEASYCGIGRQAMVASAFPHLGEEDCLRGWQGSGTIFFSRCNLKCVFCQNADISQAPAGQPLDADQLARRMLALQDQGCHNINLVTPEHVVPQVLEAIAVAIADGLRLPIVYNTSGYDSVASLKLLDGIIDIYMPDFKFWKPATAQRLCKATDYPESARRAILEMHRQVGALKLTPNGLACRGVLVRHLVMPGQADEAAAIFHWLSSEVSRDTFVNIMPQYRPAHRVGTATQDGSRRYAEIDRRTTLDDWSIAVQAARDAGLWRFDPK